MFVACDFEIKPSDGDQCAKVNDGSDVNADI